MRTPASSLTQDPKPDELLQFLPDYGVLICTSCKYAVQPAAVSRHLKELHHILRSRRQPFMDYVSRLDLRSPEDVFRSKIFSFPVPIIPVEEGLACNLCSPHFCVSEKRSILPTFSFLLSSSVSLLARTVFIFLNSHIFFLSYKIQH
jgi:hypothetical protein